MEDHGNAKKRKWEETLEKKEDETTIDLTSKGIAGLSPDMTKLTKLVLCQNQLKKVDFSHFTNLTHLDLSYNNFAIIPPTTSKLTNLTDLNLANNRIKFPEFTHFPKLLHLDVSANGIDYFPPSILEFESLTSLNLCANHMEEILPSIRCRLTSLHWSWK